MNLSHAFVPNGTTIGNVHKKTFSFLIQTTLEQLSADLDPKHRPDEGLRVTRQ